MSSCALRQLSHSPTVFIHLSKDINALPSSQRKLQFRLLTGTITRIVGVLSYGCWKLSWWLPQDSQQLPGFSMFPFYFSLSTFCHFSRGFQFALCSFQLCLKAAGGLDDRLLLLCRSHRLLLQANIFSLNLFCLAYLPRKARIFLSQPGVSIHHLQKPQL